MPTLDDVYRFLLTPRWLALHVVVLLVIPAFVLLGQWQFGRFEERSTSSHRITGNLGAAPVAVEELTTPGGTVSTQDKYRTVLAKGTYDANAQLLVRRRVQDKAVGFYVLTPLVTANGTGVLVNRGWVRAGVSADALPEVPAPSSGEVTVTGRLRPTETEETSGIRDRAGLPAGQVLLINTEAIGRRLPYKLLGGFVELIEQSPAAAAGAPAPVPTPDVGEGGGLNLAYGVQWWLFIGVAIGGWALLIRREAADLRAAASAPAATGGPGPGDPDPGDPESEPGGPGLEPGDPGPGSGEPGPGSGGPGPGSGDPGSGSGEPASEPGGPGSGPGGPGSGPGEPATPERHSASGESPAPGDPARLRA
ncbi:SURF1 family protein [Streptosporangium sp. NPDC002524]|uniref:SURF1 family cytochrome oxidase biogenesis protein n=1 Tax=Streptosporangium sp. NPDC002524 TaxID=3154537 RepID=UPI003327A33C